MDLKSSNLKFPPVCNTNQYQAKLVPNKVTSIEVTKEELEKVKSSFTKLINSGKRSKNTPANVGAFLKKIKIF